MASDNNPLRFLALTPGNLPVNRPHSTSIIRRNLMGGTAAVNGFAGGAPLADDRNNDSSKQNYVPSISTDNHRLLNSTVHSAPCPRWNYQTSKKNDTLTSFRLAENFRSSGNSSRVKLASLRTEKYLRITRSLFFRCLHIPAQLTLHDQKSYGQERSRWIALRRDQLYKVLVNIIKFITIKILHNIYVWKHYPPFNQMKWIKLQFFCSRIT